MNASSQSTFESAASALEAIIQTGMPQDMPAYLGELERLKVVAGLRLHPVTFPSNPATEPGEQLLNIEGIARYLRVPVYTARQLAKTKGFPFIKIGKHLRVEPDALKIWARKHLNKEVDLSLYEPYNEEYHGGSDPQENQKKNGTHPGPTCQEVGCHRQHGGAVGAG